MTLLYQGGIAVGWKSTSPTQRVELLRSPDDGSGGPDTANEISLAIVAPGTAGFVDLSAGVSLTRFHYRVRHVFPGYNPGTATKHIRGHGVEFNPNQVVLPVTSNSLSTTAQTPNSLWIQAGGTILTAFFTPAQFAIFATLSLTTEQTTTSVANYGETQNTFATIRALRGHYGLVDTRHTSGTVSAAMVGVQGLSRVSGAGGTTTWARGVQGVVETTAGTTTNSAWFYGAHGATGGTLTNAYGLYLESVTQGATLNYALYTNAGRVALNAGGSTTSDVIIGTTTASEGNGLEVARSIGANTGQTERGTLSRITCTAAATQVRVGFEAGALVTSGAGTLSHAWAIEAYNEITGASTVTNMRGIQIQSLVNNAGAVVTEYNGIRILDVIETAGSVTNTYGILIENLTSGGTNNYAIYTSGGNFTVHGSTGAVSVGALTATTVSGVHSDAIANTITAAPSSATYTGAAFRSVASRASSSAFYHFYASSNSVEMAWIRGDGAASFGALTASGNALIGTTTPATGSPRLDVVVGSGSIAAVLSDGITDAVNKIGRLAGRHYTNAEEALGLIHGASTTSAGLVRIGGGDTSVNAATEVQVYTAANNTTTTGTEAARFNNTTTAANVRFMIYDVDNATLEQVSVGIADSGGVGFKLLRIAN